MKSSGDSSSSFLHRCATSVYLGAVNGQQCRALGWCCFPSVQSRLCSAVSLIAVSRLLSYSRRSLVSVSGRARARRSAACSQKHGEILGQECQMSRIWAITFKVLYIVPSTACWKCRISRFQRTKNDRTVLMRTNY